MVTNKELLAVYEGLKFHHNLIYGCNVTVMTDHKNLTHESTQHTSHRVLRQRVAIDQEYGAKIVYYEGTLNTGADGLSQLPFDPTSANTTTEALFAIETATHDVFPLDLQIIAKAQKEDAKLNCILDKTSQANKIGQITVEDTTLRTFNGKIWVPETLRKQLILWYHKNLQHAGATRLLNPIGIHFGYPGIRKDIDDLVCTCDSCQKLKITGKKQYGKIPLTPALQDKEPWQVVHIDCTSPWDLQFLNDITQKVETHKLDLLTIADACLGWTEFAVMKNTTSKHTAHLFDTNWLCHYPRPQKVVYNNGSEFIGWEFQELLDSYGITAVPTTVKNPQANSIV